MSLYSKYQNQITLCLGCMTRVVNKDLERHRILETINGLLLQSENFRDFKEHVSTAINVQYEIAKEIDQLHHLQRREFDWRDDLIRNKIKESHLLERNLAEAQMSSMQIMLDRQEKDPDPCVRCNYDCRIDGVCQYK